MKKVLQALAESNGYNHSTRPKDSLNQNESNYTTDIGALLGEMMARSLII